MAKLICIRKSQHKIVLTLNGEIIADIAIANSSRSSSVNLSIDAPSDVQIDKASMGTVKLN